MTKYNQERNKSKDYKINNFIKLVSVKELSEIIRIKESTLYAWTEKRKMPFIRLNGLLRFDLDEVIEWIKSSKILPSEVHSINLKPKKITPTDISKIIKREVVLSKKQCYDSSKRGNQTSQAQRGGKHAVI